jgi:protein TonB
MSAASHTGPWPAAGGPEIARWSLAAVVVVAAHLAVAYTIGTLLVKDPRPAAEEALTVDLTPFIMTQAEQEQPDVLQEDTSEPVLEEVQQEDVVEETETAELQETPIDEQPTETEPDVVEPVTESVQPDQPDVVTETIETPPAEVVIPKPVKKPVPKKPRPVVKKQEKAPEKVVRKPVTKKAAAANPARGKNQTTQAEAHAARAPSVNPARWHSQVYAAIARRKPRDRGVSGRVSIHFVVSASGAILSAGIARSSGNSALDSAALAMVRGARVPAPPANLPGSRHPFTVPVVFQ